MNPKKYQEAIQYAVVHSASSDPRDILKIEGDFEELIKVAYSLGYIAKTQKSDDKNYIDVIAWTEKVRCLSFTGLYRFAFTTIDSGSST